MNKKLLMYLCGVVICFMAACSDNEDEQTKPQEQPKETPEVIEEAIAPLNEIMLTEGRPVIAPAGSTKEKIREHINTLFDTYLQKEGLEYQTWRRWGVLDAKIGNQFGFQSPKNSLLPIPKAALMQYPELKQNAGYY